MYVCHIQLGHIRLFALSGPITLIHSACHARVVQLVRVNRCCEREALNHLHVSVDMAQDPLLAESRNWSSWVGNELYVFACCHWTL